MNEIVNTDNLTTVDQSNEALEFFKALSNVERLKVAGLLAVEPLNVSRIAGRLSWPLPMVIKQLEYLPDFAALRRYMVDEGMLARKDGVYWLVTQ